MMGDSTSPILLEACGIGKSFGPIRANDSIHFQVRADEVHALIGENGAGKSTLVGILFGLIQPDAGEIRFQGQTVRWDHPGKALASGVGLVQQHVTLVPDLTVAENIQLGCEPVRGGLLDRRAAWESVAALAQQYGLKLDPSQRVDRLTVGEQQQVEIAKVLRRGIRVLMLDEPTALLSPLEIDAFLLMLRSIAQRGLGVVFISHKLPEVEKVADRITVLRQGKCVWHGVMANTNTQALASAMVGNDHARGETIHSVPSDEIVLDIRELESKDERRCLGPLSLQIRRGEILGIAGMAGSGQELLLDVLLGHRAVLAGEIVYAETSIASLSPGERLRMGIGYIPQDRELRATIPDTSLADHLLIRRAGRETTSWGWIDPSCLHHEVQRLIDDFHIAAPGPETCLDALSGGHQQRSILAFELNRNPKILLLHDPTRGLDWRATMDVRDRLHHAARNGVAMIWVSSDISELLELSHRIAVIYQGRIADIVDARKTNLQQIGWLMTGLQ